MTLDKENIIEIGRIEFEAKMENPDEFENWQQEVNEACKRIVIVSEPRFNELDDLLWEAEQRVWSYRSYMGEDSDLPEDIKKDRDAARVANAVTFNLDDEGRPTDDTFDSYEYWEGVMAACRYLSGYGICQTIENVRTGEDLLDT